MTARGEPQAEYSAGSGGSPAAHSDVYALGDRVSQVAGGNDGINGAHLCGALDRMGGVEIGGQVGDLLGSDRGAGDSPETAQPCLPPGLSAVNHPARPGRTGFSGGLLLRTTGTIIGGHE
jgi:hypothetical protein